MKYIKEFTKGIIKENPLFVSILGLCPALAITTKLQNAIGMGISFIFVLTMSNIVISLIKNIIPNNLRIPTFIIIISTFVTILEMLLNAYFPEISKSLGIYLSLIVVNCIILGRAEAFASKNNILLSFFDGLGIGIGYTISLIIISLIREILGNGTITLWNNIIININKSSPIFTQYFISSSGGYLIIGIIFAFINFLKRGKKNEHIKLDN